MPILHKNINAEVDIHNPKWFPNANNGDVSWKNELGNLESTDELVLPAALDFVDASVAPPTTNAGDIYVLASGGSVEAGWGAVALDDWVRYDGTSWNSITPQKSILCYDKTTDALQFFDGTNWAAVASGIQNLTTAAKSALSPSTGDFVYDTDLDSFQRYDGSSWVDLAKGYGVASIKNSSGIPTYYSTLESAFSAASAGDTIQLYTDVTVTSTISISGKNNMTLVGNGHTITHTSNTGSEFELFEGTTAAAETLYFVGVKVVSNGTGTGSGSSVLDYVNLYQDETSKITSTNNYIAFISGVIGGTLESTNSYALFSGWAKYCKITSDNLRVIGDPVYYCDITLTDRWSIQRGIVEYCKIVGNSTSGDMIDNNTEGTIRNSVIISTTGANDALYGGAGSSERFVFENNIIIQQGTGRALYNLYPNGMRNCYVYSEGNQAIRAIHSGGTAEIINCRFENNATANQAAYFGNFGSATVYLEDIQAECINASNTQPAIRLEANGGIVRLVGGRAKVANSSVAEIEVVNNASTSYGISKMSLFGGTGINWNGLTNLQTTAEDSAGNISID